MFSWIYFFCQERNISKATTYSLTTADCDSACYYMFCVTVNWKYVFGKLWHTQITQTVVLGQTEDIENVIKYCYVANSAVLLS